MIEGLFDSTATLSRPQDEIDELGDFEQSYAPLGTFALAIVPPKQTLRGTGYGEEEAGSSEAYFSLLVDVQPRDVLDVLTGPEAGTRWRVLSSSKLRSSHTEAVIARQERR